MFLRSVENGPLHTLFVRMLCGATPFTARRTRPARHGWPREVPRRGAVATSAIRTVHTIRHGEVEGGGENGMRGLPAMQPPPGHKAKLLASRWSVRRGVDVRWGGAGCVACWRICAASPTPRGAQAGGTATRTYLMVPRGRMHRGGRVAFVCRTADAAYAAHYEERPTRGPAPKRFQHPANSAAGGAGGATRVLPPDSGVGHWYARQQPSHRGASAMHGVTRSEVSRKASGALSVTP